MPFDPSFDAFYLALDAVARAAARGIELSPLPRATCADCPSWIAGEVIQATPKGHYFALCVDEAQIVAVDDYRPSPGTYADLLQGYGVDMIEAMPVVDRPDLHGRFVRIHYLRKIDMSDDPTSHDYHGVSEHIVAWVRAHVDGVMNVLRGRVDRLEERLGRLEDNGPPQTIGYQPGPGDVGPPPGGGSGAKKVD